MSIKKVCLIAGDKKLSKMLIREITSLVNAGYEISHFLIEEKEAPEKPASSKLVNYLKSRLKYYFRISNFIGIEKRFSSAKKFRQTNEELSKKCDVLDIKNIGNPKIISFKPVKDGRLTYKIDEDLVKKITDEVDVVVLLGFYKILRGGILTAPRYGTLSFHGSDFTKYRGRPGGLFQFINDEDKIGCTLQQLTNELDGGRIILCHHADISDATTLEEVLNRRYQLYDNMLVKGFELLSDPNFKPRELNKNELGQLTFSNQQDDLENLLTYWHNYYLKRLFPSVKRRKVKTKS